MQHDPVALAKSELRKARSAALASLPVELRDALAREAEDRIAKRSERRRLRVARALFIAQRAILGDKPEEVAERLGISPWALRKFCSRWAVVMGQRKGFRRIGAWIDDRLVSALDAYAEAAGVSREKAASELLSNVLRARQARRAAA